MNKKVWVAICTTLFAIGMLCVVISVYQDTQASVERGGVVRMVRAWKYDDHGLVDETGNIWDYNGPIDGNSVYTLYIDNMGTPQVEDDRVVRMWKDCEWLNPRNQI